MRKKVLMLLREAGGGYSGTRISVSLKLKNNGKGKRSKSTQLSDQVEIQVPAKYPESAGFWLS